MEEKIVARGILSNSITIVKTLVIILSVVGLAGMLTFVIRDAINYSHYGWDFSYHAKLGVSALNICAIIIVFVCIWAKRLRKTQIFLTENRIYGNKAGGKEFDVPLEAVKHAEKGAFQSLVINTDAKVYRFHRIKNCKVLSDEINKLLPETIKTSV